MEINQVKIQDIISHSEDIKTYILEKPAMMDWIEGAHTHLALMDFDVNDSKRKEFVRHMSITTLADEHVIGITTKKYKNTSLYKEKLWNYKVNDVVKLFNTHSRLSLKRENQPIVLLSMGVALASVYPLIKAYSNDPFNIKSMSLYHVSKEGFLYSDLHNYHYSTCNLHHLTNRSSYYKQVENESFDHNTTFYIVGSDDFIMDTILILKKKKIKKQQVILDKNELLSYHYCSSLD